MWAVSIIVVACPYAVRVANSLLCISIAPPKRPAPDNSDSAGTAQKRQKTESARRRSAAAPATLTPPPSQPQVGDQDGDMHLREFYVDASRFAKFRVEDESGADINNIRRDAVTKFFSKDYTFLAQKPDHQARPLWVCDDGRIILEAFSSLAHQAQDFLITIAEPVSRPARIHEFRLTAYSLYAAVSVGMETDTILAVLERFSKVTLPQRVVKFIRDCTTAYGKVKLVLKDNRYAPWCCTSGLWYLLAAGHLFSTAFHFI